MSANKLTIRLPGSTTNLGPGFDTLGLALSVYTTVTFERSPALAQPQIILKGQKAQSLPADTDNLIYKVFSQYVREKELARGIKLTIETEIPLARGLGSSSTAILAALWAAQAFASGSPDRAQVLAQAAAIEGHPDNVAACLNGGFIISAYRISSHQPITQCLTWPEKWHTLVVVPPYPLSTEEARKVLPRRVGIGQAVNNVQRTGLLIGAVANGDEEALKEALHDELHEPYRLHLVPELQMLRRELKNLPALGCVLSGAGSSSLVIVHEKDKAEIKRFLEDWAKKQKQEPEILDLTVDKTGLVATYE